MRFRTVCITRVKLKAAILFAVIAAVLCVLVVLNMGAETAPVFNAEDEAEYVEILSESLPTEDSFDISEKIKAIIGFDTDEPETVIGEFSPIFKAESDKATVQEEPSGEEPSASAEPTQEAPEPTEYKAPEFPSKAEIMAGVGLEMNNASSYKPDLKALSAQELSFSVETNSEPQVLIVHTHTTECFNGDAMSGETERNADGEKNMIAVGNVIAEVLESNGIHCVHDETVHDYPSYQGAYTRALSTIEYNLKKYPQIKVVLDVHRDAYIYPDGSKLTVKCEQNGISTAKVMLVLGTDSLGLSHPYWKENLSFAAKIQSAANIMYPGMMRPINLRRERFNMHTTKGSILIEVGSNGNTLDEAKEGGKNIAQAISAVLLAK